MPSIVDLSTHTYVDDKERFLVVLAVSYAEKDLLGDDRPATPESAAAAALELTRDLGSGSTHWQVWDRKTDTWRLLEQSDFESGVSWP